MEKVYFLDLLTLIANLGKQAAVLITVLPRGGGGLNEPCSGIVRIFEGKILSCLIEGRSGRRLEGDSAYVVLRDREEWRVRLEAAPPTEPIERRVPFEAAPSIFRQEPISGRFAIVPQQAAPLHASHIERLAPRNRVVLRMVLSLVNGERSVDQIKEQLNVSPETVDQVLAYLKSVGVIM